MPDNTKRQFILTLYVDRYRKLDGFRSGWSVLGVKNAHQVFCNVKKKNARASNEGPFCSKRLINSSH